jgi:hypothetical protein
MEPRWLCLEPKGISFGDADAGCIFERGQHYDFQLQHHNSWHPISQKVLSFCFFAEQIVLLF